MLGPANTVAAALELLATHDPDAAVLDVNHRGEVVSPVAEALRLRRIPFVVTSANERPAQVGGDVLAGVQCLGKPTSPVALLAAERYGLA